MKIEEFESLINNVTPEQFNKLFDEKPLSVLSEQVANLSSKISSIEEVGNKQTNQSEEDSFMLYLKESGLIKQ